MIRLIFDLVATVAVVLAYFLAWDTIRQDEYFWARNPGDRRAIMRRWINRDQAFWLAVAAVVIGAIWS